MPRSRLARVSLAAIIMAFASALSLADEATPDGVEFFESHIRPVLAQHCYKCHSSQSTSVKGGLLLDTRDGIRTGGETGHSVVPGELEESLIISALRYEDFEMPPEKKLPDALIDNFVKWIEMGAPDPRDGTVTVAAPAKIDIQQGRQFWAFQPLHSVEPPKINNDSWPRGAVDQFVSARLDAAGLSPAEPAERGRLLRRAKFDLLGLPPTPEEIKRFLADSSRDAFERIVDQWLNAPQFGERWGRHWLDVARYAESMGRTRNLPFPHAWRYRDYVIASFNKNKPYDRFVREQIAGDLLDISNEDQKEQALVATGFLALGSHDLNERDAEKYTMDVVDEQINTVTRSILALNVGCARCHDHKFDPIPTADYYALAGIFRSTRVLSGLGNRKKTGKQGYFAADLLVPLRGGDDGGEAVAKAEYDRETERLQRKLDKLEARSKQLKESMRGPRQQRPTEAKVIDVEIEKAGARQESLTLQEVRQEFNRVRRELKQVAKRLREHETSAPVSGNFAMGVAEAGNPKDCRINIRGDARSLGEAVPRGFLQVLCVHQGRMDNSGVSGRLELAQWMTDPNSPAGALAARVMANRVWYHLFGTGLVRTVDNFGETGQRPTHPELLEYLAAQLVGYGWSVKSLIREIVLSGAYQQGCRGAEPSQEEDPGNQLMGRQNVRRLQVESIRDAILAVSGNLDTKPPVGSPVMTMRQGKINRGMVGQWVDGSRHRSVYAPILRGFVPNMFETFDFAEPSEVNGRRDITTVAPQALFMMNSSFVQSQARDAAQRLLRSGGDDQARVELAYLSAVGRKPTEDESERALRQLAEITAMFGQGEIGERSWSSLYQALFSCAEFRYVE